LFHVKDVIKYIKFNADKIKALGKVKVKYTCENLISNKAFFHDKG